MPDTIVTSVNDPAGYDVYIGRGSPRRRLPESIWANPFKISEGRSRAQVLTLYEEHVRSSPELLARLAELEGKRLGCWCKTADAPDTPCHGDVLVKLLKERMPHEP